MVKKKMQTGERWRLEFDDGWKGKVKGAREGGFTEFRQGERQRGPFALRLRRPLDQSAP